ncbi:hypothetical protein [Prosthecobacter dejongeii]|uniref:Uncharacterized protein n=1 Tax=Prosthecobacter dejongeii TaxID=48465 RepID=A0A7W7YJX4_9BACT|nr:hypothetical protein [Prosthecobacter dejongeii]MBB5037469.1 hypothetical protein [Prosthecobacter dejongeii]
MKSILGILFCVALVGFSFFTYLKDKQMEASQVRETTRRQLNLSKTALADRHSYVETLKRHYELQRRLYDSNQALVEARSVMVALNDAIETQKRAYQNIVEARRGSARGSVIEFLELPDGKVLRTAKVLNFDDTNLSVQTGDGILKIPAQDLPAHLKDYFRLDLIEPETTQALDTVVATSSTSFKDSAPKQFQYSNISMEPTGAELTYDEKVKVFGTHINAITKRINQLQQAKNAPFVGMDAHLKPGTAAYRHRQKDRAQRLDREIAILTSKRKVLEIQRKKFTSPTVTTR